MQYEMLQGVRSELESMGILVRQVSQEQISTRCAFCGDSTKSTYSTHMYIGIPRDCGLLSYYCQRCNVGGYVNDTFFKQYSVINIELRSQVVRSLRESLSNINRNISRNSKFSPKDFNYDFCKRLDNNNYLQHYKTKFDYLEERLGIDFTQGDHLKTYRVVISPFDFLKDIWNISSQRKYDELIEWDAFCVGFLTNDGSRIILRSIHPDAPVRRYHHETLFYHDNPIFYSPRTQLDTDRPVTLNFCEGIFDSINLSRDTRISPDNSMNVAVLSKEYATKINYLVDIIGSLRVIDSINIYSDSEVSVRYMKRILHPVGHLSRKIRVYKNATSDDFGEYEENFIIRQVSGVF